MGARTGALVGFALALILSFAASAAAQYKGEQAKDPPSAVKDPAAERARPQPRPRQPALTVAPDDGKAAATSDQCQWLGKRIISLLIRDDAMAANDFTPFFVRFGCPEELLADAFGCVAANAALLENNGLSEQINACWLDPTVRLAKAEDNAGGTHGQPAAAAKSDKDGDKAGKAGPGASPTPRPERPEPPVEPTKTSDPPHRAN
ncbi:MAG: hypothetical protein WAS73_10380 [Defluviicoccus sp.]